MRPEERRILSPLAQTQGVLSGDRETARSNVNAARLGHFPGYRPKVSVNRQHRPEALRCLRLYLSEDRGPELGALFRSRQGSKGISPSGSSSCSSGTAPPPDTTLGLPRQASPLPNHTANQEI